MFHRFSTWWRALSVVLLGLATFTWPSAARAQATTAFSVISQDAVAHMSSAGNSSFNIDISVPVGTTNNVTLGLYSPVVYRSEVSAIVSGTGPNSSPIATTSVSSPSCASGTSFAFRVALFSATGSGPSALCGNQPLHLRLPCQSAACDGVYPLRIAVNVNGT